MNVTIKVPNTIETLVVEVVCCDTPSDDELAAKLEAANAGTKVSIDKLTSATR